MRALLTIALFGIGLTAAVYALACALLYFKQDAFLFPGAFNDPALVRRHQSQRISIPTDGLTLDGWWIGNPNSDKDITLLYFGGNAEDVLHTVDTLDRMNVRHLLTINYRGYGGAQGQPGETALLNDALAAYDYLVGQLGVSARNLVIMGRSLGSGIAGYVAAHRPVRGVILTTPYDDMAEVAHTHYPFFPVRLLLRHRFPAVQWAHGHGAPVLILAAENDAVIPSHHAQRLFAAWTGRKEIHILDNVGHNDIERHPHYYSLIDSFLNMAPNTAIRDERRQFGG